MCEVVNKREAKFDVYIGRGSRWGNPFVLGRDGDRKEVIYKYWEHLVTQIQNGEVTLDDLRSLNGKKLGCFCKPLPCHGDVIRDAVAWAVAKRNEVVSES